MSLSAVFTFLFADLLSRKSRFLATVIAIGIAAGILLAALISLQFAQKNVPRKAAKILNPDEIHLVTTDPIYSTVDTSLLEELKKDARIDSLDLFSSTKINIMPGNKDGSLNKDALYSLDWGAGGWGGWLPMARLQIGSWHGNDYHAKLKEGRWPEVNAEGVLEIVIPDRGLPNPTHMNDYVRLESDSGVHLGMVVGIIDTGSDFIFTEFTRRLPQMLALQKTIDMLAGTKDNISAVRIKLKDGVNKEEFLSGLEDKLLSFPGRLESWDQSTFVKSAQEGWEINSARSAVITAIVLAGSCVVALVLAVQVANVRERVSEYKLLRSLGAKRSTIFLSVIAYSSLIAIGGLLVSIGLAWGTKIGLSRFLPFVDGRPPNALSIIITFGVILIACILGGLWPAISAANSQLFDNQQETESWVMKCFLLGIVTCCICIVLNFVKIGDHELRARILGWVVIPCVVLTGLLLTPLVISMIAKLAIPLIARLISINSLLLSDQVSGDARKSVGAVATLAIGLGSFITMMIWGASMLDLFVIDTGIPRWFVSAQPYGLSKEEVQKIVGSSLLHNARPLLLLDTRLAEYPKWGKKDVETLVMGVDVEREFSGGKDALPIKFRSGSAIEARHDLVSGEGCLVSDWFAVLKGLKLGESIPVADPHGGDHAFKIAGIVDLKGWLMLSKSNKVRTYNQKHEVMIILSDAVVREKFDTAYANYFLGDTLDKNQNVSVFPTNVTHDCGYVNTIPDRTKLEDGIESLLKLDQSIDYPVEGGRLIRASPRVIQVQDLGRIRNALLGHWGGQAVQQMGIIPLTILLLGLLPVVGTLVSTQYSRARELGILRFCGLSRWGIIRLVIGQSLLICISTIFIAAIVGGISANLMLEVTTLMGHGRFNGLLPGYLIPWVWLWPGIIITVVICLFAALWAGWRISRSDLALLTAARPYRQ